MSCTGISFTGLLFESYRFIHKLHQDEFYQVAEGRLPVSMLTRAPPSLPHVNADTSREWPVIDKSCRALHSSTASLQFTTNVSEREECSSSDHVCTVNEIQMKFVYYDET
eukprot:6198723-Pleurochrysis_carterae.AAC.1